MKIVRTLLPALLTAVVVAPAHAQEKRALDHADYAIWNRIQGDLLSSDGRWLAYRLVPGDGDAAMIVRALDGDGSVTIERGASPRFSASSRYLVAMVEPMESAVDAAREEGGRDADVPKDSLAIVDLDDLSVTRVADVSSFELPEDEGDWVAYLLDAEDEGEGDEEGEQEPAEGEEDESPDAPRLDDGAPLVVRMLDGGDERSFEHVAEYDFAADGVGPVLRGLWGGRSRGRSLPSRAEWTRRVGDHGRGPIRAARRVFGGSGSVPLGSRR